VSAPRRWTDAHCHLPADRSEAAAVIEDAHAAGVERLINVGTDAETSRDALAVARTSAGVWATAGLHPHDATNGLDGIDTLLDDDRVVGVGECGLDFHYDHSPRPTQRDMFVMQIRMANERDLPLVIHTREAWDDTFAALEAAGVPRRTIFHCFTGGSGEAQRALDLGAFLSFSGIVTFPSADDVRAAAAICPLSHLLVETDSPYLAPVPHRGRPNRPALVAVVGEAVAAVKGVAPDAVAEATWAATTVAFGLSEM
jgi:TatD DNase family protein